ncbi:Heterogeneous nuclear ribonucleoprotein A1, partial [Galemys pyrenaicus]
AFGFVTYVTVEVVDAAVNAKLNKLDGELWNQRGESQRPWCSLHCERFLLMALNTEEHHLKGYEQYGKLKKLQWSKWLWWQPWQWQLCMERRMANMDLVMMKAALKVADAIVFLAIKTIFKSGPMKGDNFGGKNSSSYGDGGEYFEKLETKL